VYTFVYPTPANAGPCNPRKETFDRLRRFSFAHIGRAVRAKDLSFVSDSSEADEAHSKRTPHEMGFFPGLNTPLLRFREKYLLVEPLRPNIRDFYATVILNYESPPTFRYENTSWIRRNRIIRERTALAARISNYLRPYWRSVCIGWTFFRHDHACLRSVCFGRFTSHENASILTSDHSLTLRRESQAMYRFICLTRVI